VIDHHRLGNLSTKYPITFINKVVGATCTIIANLYREAHVPMEKEIASLLLCGILADTLSLHSATTTDTDRNTADYLASVTGLDIAQLGLDLQTEANRVNAMAVEELIAMDMKEYAEAGAEFSVSQVETDRPEDLVARRSGILGELENIARSRKYLFSALLVTDVITLDSLFFVYGSEPFVAQINFPRRDDGVYVMKDVVSRKKQLIPLLLELVEKV
jgi:manganese-dependent inorganic pyrophosphatase